MSIVLKNLLVLTFALLLLPFAGVGQSGKAHHKSADKKPPSPVTPISPKEANSSYVEGSNKQHVDADVRVVSTPSKDCYDKAVVWLNAILAVIGIAGIMVAGLTLIKIERQTKATEDAAAASLKQVEHMVTSERPFLMIEVREGSPGSYHFYAINEGRSPAQLIFINPIPTVSVTKFGEELDNEPWYGFGFYEEGVMVINEQWIKTGGDRNIGSLDSEVIKMWAEGNPGLNTGEQELLVRGAIKYRGRFSEEIWHSKYCYRVFPNGLRMAGPVGWNDYT